METPNTVNTRLPTFRNVDNPRKINDDKLRRLKVTWGTGKMPPKLSYTHNDVCFIRLPFLPGLYKGRVCGELSDTGTTGTYYIVKLDNPSWPVFEIRDATLMLADESGSLPAIEDLYDPYVRVKIPQQQ
jgi:hypothetical protein